MRAAIAEASDDRAVLTNPSWRLSFFKEIQPTITLDAVRADWVRRMAMTLAPLRDQDTARGSLPPEVALGEALRASGIEPTPDGIAVDAEGRIWSSSGDGVHVLAPEGQRLAHIPVPETVANLCFGDDGWLWIAATTSIYRIRTATRGA